ncbi:MAG: HlyD family efflux transporter periplasmic adaptor subunit [Anaerolineales bacterium]|nr:HlyD family efflux transporter periplasmic adaptor subunit [Anaerolineales bacterium]
MKTKTVVFFVIVLGLLLTACGAGNTSATEAAAVPTVKADDTVISEGRVEPVRFVEFGFSAGGLISEVLVKQGDPVEAGQVIARLESGDAQTLETAQAATARELADANEAVRVAQNALDDFDIPTDLKPMGPEEAVRDTYGKLEKARADYEPYKYKNRRKDIDDNREDCTIKNGIETCRDTAKGYEKTLNDAWADYRKAIQWLEREAALENAQARLSEAQKNYDSLQDGANPEDTAGTRASLANAELRAPFSGTVAKLDIKVGEPASVGTIVVTIADFSTWAIKTTDLTEIDVVNIKQGQKVTITLDALPDVELTGTVDAIGQTFSEKQGDIVYEVIVLLIDTDPNLRWGMTAEVKFEK